MNLFFGSRLFYNTNSPSPRKISTGFDCQNNKLICTITDDGIGYSKSIELKENSVTAHQSMALEITKKRLEIMEATTSQSASVSINEITVGDSVMGTKVVIALPAQYTSDTKKRL